MKVKDLGPEIKEQIGKVNCQDINCINCPLKVGTCMALRIYTKMAQNVNLDMRKVKPFLKRVGIYYNA